MAYLFKHTPLQTNFIVNLTCLIPTENAEVGRPERLDLHAILWHFLHFRLEVVTQPPGARARGAQEAHPHPRGLREGLRRARRDHQDHPQVGRQGRRRARKSSSASRSTPSRPTRSSSSRSIAWRASRFWSSRTSPTRSASARGKSAAAEGRGRAAGRSSATRSRRSRRSTATRDARFSSTRCRRGRIHRRRLHRRRRQRVIVSRDGWVKRQKEVKDVGTTRLREGDQVLAVLAGSTRATAVFFSNFGVGLHAPASPTCPHRPATASRFSSCSSSRTASGSSPRSASIRASLVNRARRRKAPSRRCTRLP